MRTRKALAFVRCVQDRDLEGRHLLVGVALDRLEPAMQADVLTVRALAELQLRDIAQARRLIEFARRHGHATALLELLDKAATAAQQQTAQATAGGGEGDPA